MLDDLYKVRKSDLKTAGCILGKAFQDDPAWVNVIPDDKERKQKLPAIFEYLIIYTLRYGEVYAPSENLEGIAVWIPHYNANMTFWKVIRSGAIWKAIKMGAKIGNKIQRVFEEIEKDRNEYMKEKGGYMYLQAIGVSPEYQGQGFGGKLLRAMFEKANSENFLIYLETETEDNVAMYKKLGFKVIKEFEVQEFNFTFWEMIREPIFDG